MNIKKPNTSNSDSVDIDESGENNTCKDELIFTDENPRDEKYDNIVIGLFSFKGRMNRLEYFKISFMAFFFGIVNLVYFIPTATKEFLIGLIITITLLLLALLPITVRRLHDSNHSGSYILIHLFSCLLSGFGNSIHPHSFLVPTPPLYFIIMFISLALETYFIYLTLRHGNPCPNNYGKPNPSKKYSNRTVHAICIFLFILTIVSGMLSRM